MYDIESTSEEVLTYISARHPRWMRRPLTTVNGYGLRNECEAVGGWQNPEGG